MNDFTLVYPMFAMVILTATVLVILFRSRVRAVRGGKVNTTYFRTYQGEIEPDETAKPSRHFVNLFEAPTLFYAACVTAMIVHDSAIAVQVLAWLYVPRAWHTRSSTSAAIASVTGCELTSLAGWCCSRSGFTSSCTWHCERWHRWHRLFHVCPHALRRSSRVLS